MTRALAGARVVVLGGAGYLGSAVAARFSSAGARVRVVSRAPRPLAFPAEVVAADLTEPAEVAAAVAGTDVVLPLVLYAGAGSWRIPPEHAAAAERVNVGVVAAAVAAARGATVVHAGTTSVAAASRTEYDRQKLAAERIVLAAGGCGLRLPTVYGPGPHGPGRGVVTAMARRALAGDELTVWGDGAALRDLVYVDDVAEAFLTAVGYADRLAGRHWLVGTGCGVRVRGLFERVASPVSTRTGRPPVAVTSVPPPEEAEPTDHQDLVADPSAFRAATGWRPRVPLATGVDRTVTALLHHGQTARSPLAPGIGVSGC